MVRALSVGILGAVVLAACGAPPAKAPAAPLVNAPSGPVATVKSEVFPGGDPLDGGGGPLVVPAHSPGKHPGPCAANWSYGDGGPWMTVRYSYDAAGNLLEERSDHAGQQYTYDSRERVVAYRMWMPTMMHPYEETWTYDPEQLVAAMADTPDEEDQHRYLYNSNGDLAEVDTYDLGGSLLAKTRYRLQPDGQPSVATTTRPDGSLASVERWTYDSGGLATDVLCTAAADTSPCLPADSKSYRYGRLVHESRWYSSGVRTDDSYRYFINGLLHLHAHAGDQNAVETFAYDARGNQIDDQLSIENGSRSESKYSFDTDDNVLQKIVSDTATGSAYEIVNYDYSCWAP